MSKVILLIDHDPVVLETLNEALRPSYHTRIATRGKKALELAHMLPLPDLILLDVELPDTTGYDICAALKRDALTESIPVIFLSSHSDVADITHGLNLGAVDYVTKPVALPILQARVSTHLRLRETRLLLQDQNMHLESMVAKRTRDLQLKSEELQRNQDLTILAMGSICETRDNETGNHIHRTRGYVEILASRLSRLPRYRDSISPDEWQMIWKSAPLHDIGKVGIPDHILLKPGRFTDDEYEIMKRHTTLGRDAIHAAEIRLRAEGSFLRVAKDIAYSHHEHWNGKGYPQGLAGEAIPLSARMMAVADVYDALISKRVYKPAFSAEAAATVLHTGRGEQFDPQVVDCFFEDVAPFLEINQRFKDEFNEVEVNK